MGLVGSAPTEALRAAAEIAVRAPVVTRLTKAALAGGGPRSLDEALRWESLAQPVTMPSADLAEGIRRPPREARPRFTGR